MKKYLPKFILLLAIALGLYWLVDGFSFTSSKTSYEANTTEKSSGSKTQSGLNISNLSRHILDFSK